MGSPGLQSQSGFRSGLKGDSKNSSSEQEDSNKRLGLCKAKSVTITLNKDNLAGKKQRFRPLEKLKEK